MRPAIAIASKDLRVELRSKEMLGAMFLFSLLIVLAFRFAFSEALDSGAADIASLASSALWICFTFAAIVGMNSSFAKEKDRETLEGLLLCPVERSTIFVGKVLSNLALVFMIDLLSILFFGLFFAYDYGGQALAVVGIALLGTLTLVTAGTLIAAMSVNSKAREVLLPILLIPLVAFSVIIPSVALTNAALSGDLSGILRDVASIAGFAVIFGAAGYLVFEYVVEG